MSKRVDERVKTKIELECYNILLEFSSHTLSVCKPKEKNPNNKHIPKRFVSIGHMMIDLVIECGANIMEANDIYVGGNLDKDKLERNINERIRLQEQSIRLTYRMEHIMNMLEYEIEFADSTITYWVGLLCKLRKSLIAWKDSDKHRV